jgi:hypothetical protein
MRRILLALTISLGIHLGLFAAAAGVGMWRTMVGMPKVKLQPIDLEVKDLPLGAPRKSAPEPEPPTPVKKPRPKVAKAHDGVTVAVPRDAGVPEKHHDAAVTATKPIYDGGSGVDGGTGIDGGRRRPGDLRSNSPEGSRMIALLRLDRLRASPGSENTITAVDQLLLLLPDRRTLIGDTGLDLYRDFDALLIATPNPTDPNVTFLAARHHLSDAALRAGLDRGAKAARRSIEWKTLGGRPVGVRKQGKGSDYYMDLDDRIFALPQPSLAIMATPAYASQILGTDPTSRPKPDAPVDAGVLDAGDSTKKHGVRVKWSDLIARIDAEDKALPDDAAFMMVASNLFKANTGYAVPPNRGATDDSPLQATGEGVPQVLTVVIGLESPYISVEAEFSSKADADRWEHEVPVWRRKLQSNPMAIMFGFSSLLARTQLSRDGTTLILRAETSIEELQRLVSTLGNLSRSMLGRPR